MSFDKKNSLWLITNLFLLLFLFGFNAKAEQDPNPDSPVPVLLTDAADATRVLAVDGNRWDGRVPKTAQQAFKTGSKSVVTLFVANLDLMEGEGANAFRVYLVHQNGKTYQLQTEDISRVNKNVYALRLRLYDLQGYRGQPPASGDALIYLEWRGLASNFLKIGLGKTGGDVKIPEQPKIDFAKYQEQSDLVGYPWTGDRVRFMEQAAFGPSTELDARIRRLGLRAWLGEQLDAPYPTMPYPLIEQMPTTPPMDCSLMNNPTCYRDRYSMHPLQQWFFREAFYGNAQLRHRMAWALSQIWVTSGVQIRQSSHMIAYHKILSKNAFGNYRQLMKEVTLSPVMGDYLDTVRSTKENPNENYAREILQLFSIGLYQLNQDGTVQLDSNNQPIPTYNQENINNFAKVFTGWTYCNQTCENSGFGIINYRDPMILMPANHDKTAKTLLSYPNAPNTNIPACTTCTDDESTAAYANESLDKALDNIFNHPSLPPYISKILIQQLVTSDPSPAYVARVAQVFANNGQGTRGDLKAVVRAILLDPEARGNVKTAPRYGKLREPVQAITNLGRLFPARSYFFTEEMSDGSIAGYTNKLGQNPFNSATVFNYYPPNYIVPGTTLLAPEFAIFNTATSTSRLNLLHLLIFNGFEPNSGDSLRGTSLDYSEALPIAQADPSGAQLIEYLNRKMLHGILSDQHRAAVQTAVAAVPASNSLLRVKTAIYLIAASSQYQVQR